MSCHGVVKSFNDAKGWGFINHDGGDVFVHVKDCQEGRPQAGDEVTFDLEQDQIREGQHKALNVTGCTGSTMKGNGMKGGGKGGGNGNFSGYVKSFNDTKGWGFIDMEGIDVFLHIKDCVNGRPVMGDYVFFDVEEDAVREGQKKAMNVTGCSGTDGWKGSKGCGGYGPACSGGGWGGWGCSPYGGYNDWYGKGGKCGYGYPGHGSGYGYGGCGYNAAPCGGGNGYGGKYNGGKSKGGW